MQYILKGILDIRDRLIKDRESTSAEDEKRGNVPLFAVLETYEEFRRGLEEFRTEREALTQAGVKRNFACAALQTMSNAASISYCSALS